MPDLQSVGTVATGTALATNYTPGAPSGVVAGDLLLYPVQASCFGGTLSRANTTVPSIAGGWADGEIELDIGQTGGFWWDSAPSGANTRRGIKRCYYRIATGDAGDTPPAAQMAYTQSGTPATNTSYTLMARVYRLDGAAVSGWLGDTLWVGDNGNTASVDVPGLSVVTGSLVLVLGSCADDAGTGGTNGITGHAFAGGNTGTVTEAVDAETTGGGGGMQWAAWADATGTGSTGVYTATLSEADPHGVLLLEILVPAPPPEDEEAEAHGTATLGAGDGAPGVYVNARGGSPALIIQGSLAAQIETVTTPPPPPGSGGLEWAWELRDLAGRTIGLLNPREAKVTRRLNGPSTIEMAVDDMPALTTAAVLMGWRAPAGGTVRVLRAAGKIQAGLALAVARDQLDTLDLGATDGYGVMGERVVTTTVTFTGETPGAIVAALIEAQNARASTGLLPPDPGFGPARDRTYDRGKRAGEAIQQLAEVDDGFYFRVDPVDGPEFSRMVLLYPAPGVASAASFEYGEGTAANLAKVQVDVRPPINVAWAFGAGSGDDQLISVQWDQASIDAYGLYDQALTFSDVVIQGTLDQHARDMLRPAERRTYRVEAAAPTDNGELSTPAPWDLFDVGDTVALNIRTRDLAYTGRALVKSFTVTVDANGTERLSSLDFQED